MDIGKFMWQRHGDGSWTGTWYKNVSPKIAPRLIQSLKVEGQTKTVVFEKMHYSPIDDRVVYWNKSVNVVLVFLVEKS